MNLYKASNTDFDQIALDCLVDKLKKLQQEKEIITVALSGGSTPIPILQKLVQETLHWEKFYFFMVDERCVSLTDPQSNFGTIRKLFFDKISASYYSMIKEGITVEESIKSYHADIREIVEKNSDGFPKFDLILLGMGEDGHTASLFPNTQALNNETDIVVKNHVSQLNTDRITLTYPAILNASKILVMIKGKNKKLIFDELYAEKGTNYPMQKIVDTRDDLNWVIEIE